MICCWLYMSAREGQAEAAEEGGVRRPAQRESEAHERGIGTGRYLLTARQRLPRLYRKGN